MPILCGVETFIWMQVSRNTNYTYNRINASTPYALALTLTILSTELMQISVVAVICAARSA